MRYAYIIHVDWMRQQGTATAPSPTLEPEQNGLILRTAGPCDLWTSIDTSVIDLPGDGCVVGDLYFLNGTRIRDAGQLPVHLSPAVARKYMLENCWGDYILVQPVPGNPRAFTVLRSPSHACELACFYSLGNGESFITSDITLARKLRSYQRRIDYESIIHRLVYPDVRTSRTALVGVSELLPGQAIYLHDGSSEVRQDWNPWSHVAPEVRFGTIDEAVSAVRDAVGMAVKALADRDKRVLLELSGGLDSSIVGACLKHSSASVSCTTFTAPSPGADEQDYATQMTHMLGVGLLHTELRFEDARI